MALTPEQIAATEFFVEAEYVASKVARLVANGKYADKTSAEAAFRSKWTGDMIDHYLQYGAAENANPSNAFDNTKYAETVAAAEGKDYTVVWAELTTGGKSPLADYLDRGKDLGYAATAVPADEAVVVGGGTTGQTYTLTSGTDRGADFTGTSDNDTFNAWLEQNSMAGGVSNSLSSADRLDGGAGNDVLNAELVTEFVGADTGYNIDVQPTTVGIEEVRIEARDFASQAGNVVTLDAKNMKDIVKIGSLNSDGDLVIENLTTLTSAGEIRKPGDLTITMDHTDNFNSDNDASDLTVYFDEDYLVTTTSTQGSSLTVKINNVLNIREGNNPVENFTAINFTVGTTAVAVDITGSTTYDDVVNKINAQLTAQGLTTVTASKAVAENVFFSMDIGGYSAGSLAGTFNPIIITNTGPETLTKGTIELAQGQTDGDINNTWTETAASTSVQPTSINIELNKVGRDGNGGNLIIGGKDQDNNGDTDKDQQDGIDIFNIKVMGDDDKPSNLGFIQSTNNSLNTVNVTEGTGWSGADLVVNTRLGEGQELTLINASAFSGDFSLGMAGPGQQALTSNFGAGNDMYNWMSSETDTNDDDGKDYSISMGAGNDVVVANLDGDSVDALGESFNLMTGEGNDTVTVDMTTGVSYETMSTIHAMKSTYLEINTAGGDDRVMLDDYGTFDIATGSGADYVEIDSNDSTDLSGSWSIFANTSDPAAVGNTWGARVLYNAKMTVSFAGFETTIDINTTSTGNYVATQALIASEIKRAIESDATLNEFLTVNIAAGTNQVTISSDIDGTNSLGIAIYQPELITAGNPTSAQTLINTADVTSLRQGLLATETVAGLSATLADANAIATWVSANNWEGSVDQTGAGNNTVAYSSAQLTNDTAEVAPDANADLLDNATFLGYTVSGTNDTVGANFSRINAGAGDDIIVLDSNVGSMNTIVVDSAFGYDRVVNFHDVATSAVDAGADVGDHILDFSAFLTDTVDTSAANGNADSATLADTNVILATTARSFADGAQHGATVNDDIDANDVAVLRFDSSAANPTSETFANLTGADLVNALNGDFDTTGDSAYGNIGALTLEAFAAASYTNATQNHIIMVENDLNEGEYKVFHVTSTIDTNTNTVVDGDFATATLLGTFDFGASVNLAISQEETVVKPALQTAIAAATSAQGSSVVTNSDDVIVNATQTADAATGKVLNKAGNLVDISTIKEIDPAATLTALSSQALTMSGVTGGITINDVGGISVLFANAIDDKFTGAVTATLSDDKMAALAALNAGPNNYSFSITDPSVDAAALTALDAKTDGTITDGGILTITGTIAEATTVLGATATNGLGGDEAVTISDTTVADVATLNTLDGATTGTINIGTVTSITGTAANLNTLYTNAANFANIGDEAVTITAMDAADNNGVLASAVGGATTGVATFQFADGDLGVAITSFAAGDKIDINALTTATSTTALTGNITPAADAVYFVSADFNDDMGTIDAALATALSGQAVIADSTVTAYIVAVDTGVTDLTADSAIYKWVDAGSNEIDAAELTLVGTVNGALTTGDIVL
jgi:hypothetical protein